MKAEKHIEIDFNDIKSLEEMHELLMTKLMLPSFYGKNVNALIDCLSSLRHPEDEMTGISLGEDEILTINIKGLSKVNEICLKHFLISIENVNMRETSMEKLPSIRLVLT